MTKMSNKKHTIYAEILEQEALNQFNQVLQQDNVVQGALMPDAHTGYVLPIGGVVSVKDAVYPAFVGYDIGCGMCSVKLDIDSIDTQKVFTDIKEAIPVGFNRYSTPQKIDINLPYTDIVKKALQVGQYQFGTLGGGNHFIEIGKGQDGAIWITIHSGSRNLGHQVAEHYMMLAKAYIINKTEVNNIIEDFNNRNKKFKEINPEKFQSALDKFLNKQLSKLMKGSSEGLYYLDVNSKEGKNYITDMNYCLEYALGNRKKMIDMITDIIGAEQIEFINRNHNHVEEKDGLWIHRKGATHAEEGMMGVIPGNMRDGCFIVRGKGNKDSLYSSSHGAGRVLSRTKAKQELKLDDFQSHMKGIVGCISEDFIDEAPNAYKNIFEVMELQKDLVEIVDYIKPILNVKG